LPVSTSSRPSSRASGLWRQLLGRQAVAQHDRDVAGGVPGAGQRQRLRPQEARVVSMRRRSCRRRESRDRGRGAAGQAEAVGVEAHGAAEVAGLGQRVDLERPQDGAAAGDDLDRQHAIGGRERGEVDVRDQLDLFARRELGGAVSSVSAVLAAARR
jgi:hypothetical protein